MSFCIQSRFYLFKCAQINGMIYKCAPCVPHFHLFSFIWRINNSTDKVNETERWTEGGEKSDGERGTTEMRVAPVKLEMEPFNMSYLCMLSVKETQVVQWPRSNQWPAPWWLKKEKQMHWNENVVNLKPGLTTPATHPIMRWDVLQ